jgi:hypothetical protein
VREGDNLYSDSVVALDPDTGRLKWHFQHTPHDTHDWDSNQDPVLIDAEFQGRQRKLLIQANRNGFYYVLDRETGEFLLGRAYVPQTWADGLDSKGRPIVIPNTDPTEEGNRVCPDAWGGTNWSAPSCSPDTGLFYVLMYADRDQYVADPVFVQVPVQGLLEPGYVRSRAKLIGETAGPAPAAGLPDMKLGADATREAAGTSHFVVIDGAGNLVSMTTTVESLFGSGRAVGGFVLNNQLSDFSYRPVVDGNPVANAVTGGKRPRSSMVPVIILDEGGQPVAALGSPGGSSILAYNAKSIVGLLAWKLPLQEAINLPNVIARGEETFGEAPKLAPGVLEALAARGVVVKPGRGEESGLHGLVIAPDGTVTGAADPRREGVWKTLP